jgi:hypothetical protein
MSNKLLVSQSIFHARYKREKEALIRNIQTLREIYSKAGCPSVANEGECGWEREQLQSLVTPATGDVCGKLQARSLYLLGKQAVSGHTTELNPKERRNLSCSCRVASPDSGPFLERFAVCYIEMTLNTCKEGWCTSQH